MWSALAISVLGTTLIVALRYALTSGGFAWLTERVRPGHLATLRPQIRREIGWSLGAAAIYGVPAGVIAWGWQEHGWTRLYTEFGWNDLWYLPLSVFAYLALHDTWFYWTHRAMHAPRLFRAMHAVHHESRPPTAWAAMSFHPWESLTGALVVPLLVFVVPIHVAGLSVVLAIMTLMGVTNHMGWEMFPHRLVHSRGRAMGDNRQPSSAPSRGVSMQLRALFQVLGSSMRHGSGFVGQFRYRGGAHAGRRRAGAVAGAALIGGVAIAAAPPAAGDVTAASRGGTVMVNVTGLRSTKGDVVACLTRHEDTFPDCAGGEGAHRLTAPAGEARSLSFPRVAPGRYAVALLHDENGNGKADRALLMMPREGVRFLARRQGAHGAAALRGGGVRGRRSAGCARRSGCATCSEPRADRPPPPVPSA